jgi:hypothetical protein
MANLARLAHLVEGVALCLEPSEGLTRELHSLEMSRE